MEVPVDNVDSRIPSVENVVVANFEKLIGWP
jgi:hypothetical protein